MTNLRYEVRKDTRTEYFRVVDKQPANGNRWVFVGTTHESYDSAKFTVDQLNRNEA